MRTPLKNLIRIHDWQVDEARRKLGDLLKVQDDLKAQLARLDEELKREQALAYENPEAATFYGNYAERVIQRRERLKQSVRKMDGEIALAREEVRAAYRELKKYQVAQEQLERAEAEERALKEQKDLDEIGLMRAVRANEI
jgi:flagellar export protein FliJ